MERDPPTRPSRADQAFVEHVVARALLRERARAAGSSVWFGLGTMGIIGWSVTVPTLLGTALGHWLDGRHPGEHSWTLALLSAGLVLGCLNAWAWVAQQARSFRALSGGPR